MVLDMGTNTEKGSFSFEDDPGALDERNVDFTFSDIPVLGNEKKRLDSTLFDSPTVSGGGDHDPALASFEALLSSDGSDSVHGDEDLSPQEMAASVTATNMEVDIKKVRSVKDAKRRKRRFAVVAVGFLVIVVVLGGAFAVFSMFSGVGTSGGGVSSSETPAERAEKKKKAQLASLLDSARKSLLDGEFAKALGTYRKALLVAPGNANASAGIGRSQEALGNISEAKKYYGKAIDGDTKDSKAYSGMVGILLKEKSYDSARSVLEKALKRFPDDKDVAYASLKLARAVCDDELALSALRSLDLSELDMETIEYYGGLRAKTSRKDARRILLYGARKFRRCNFFSQAIDVSDTPEKKIEVLNLALKELQGKKDGVELSALKLLLAKISLDDGDNDAARKALVGIEDLSDFDTAQCMDYINLHVRLGTKDMTSVISRVLKARPEDVELGLDTQRVLSASLTPNEMVDAYGAWQAENSDNSVANFLYAKALGTLDSAVELYKRAVRLNPSFYEANLELAKLYMARKRWSGAERCLVKCVEQRGADVEPKRLLAICQARRGKGAEAMGTLCAAMEKLQASPGEKAAAAIDVALLLPSPKDADRFLADLKADPKYSTLYREKNAERKLLYGGISDSDFIGLKTKVLRRYYRLYLLSKGRKKDVLIMPTPKEDFPEFWKVYLMRCMRFKAWRRNAEALYKKTANSDALTEHLIVGMWLDKISPEKAEGKLSSIPPGKEALFYFMLGDAYREKKKSAKAYINFRRAKIAPRSVEKSAVLRLLKEKGA